MRRWRLILGSLAVLLVFGAGAWAAPLGPNPEGRPGAYHPGAPMAYWIWHDRDGYHVRATTAREYHVFAGSVNVGREFTLVLPFRLEGPREYVRKVGHRIEFWLSTDGGVDGFDFRATWPHEATFDLRIDSLNPARVLQHVFVGARDAHPSVMPFTIVP